MKKISAVVIDDEPMARETLKTILEQVFTDVTVVGEAHSLATATALLTSVTPDICFLDVEMPPYTGFNVLESLPKIDFQVIFVTAHKEQAYKSYRFDALDYIIKPINIRDLRQSLEKYRAKMMPQVPEAPKPETPKLPPTSNAAGPSQIVIPELSGYLVIETQDIVRCESDRNYTKLFLSSKKSILATRTIAEFEDLLLSKGFMRVHRSHLVNLSMIVKITRGKNPELLLRDGELIPVSRDKKDELFAAFLNGSIAENEVNG